LYRLREAGRQLIEHWRVLTCRHRKRVGSKA
jgi:hypothetical protein